MVSAGGRGGLPNVHCAFNSLYWRLFCELSDNTPCGVSCVSIDVAVRCYAVVVLAAAFWSAEQRPRRLAGPNQAIGVSKDQSQLATASPAPMRGV